jgi:hypothetical protein
LISRYGSQSFSLIRQFLDGQAFPSSHHDHPLMLNEER